MVLDAVLRLAAEKSQVSTEIGLRRREFRFKKTNLRKPED